MEQSLIEKYLAGETSAQEERLLRQELQAKSFATRTKEEEALLIMLTGFHQSHQCRHPYIYRQTKSYLRFSGG